MPSQGHLLTNTTSEPRDEILSSTFSSKESTADKTRIIEKIPMITPSKDKKVLSLSATKELSENRKLSDMSLKITSFVNI
jgi:hypothetical protein